MPPHTVSLLPVLLECRFDMEGEPLYSVKWYKDGHEFYRYVPTDTPQHFSFRVHGVHVLVSRVLHTECVRGISHSRRKVVGAYQRNVGCLSSPWSTGTSH